MSPANVELHRRKLPHWHGPGGTYFVTSTLTFGQPTLGDVERDLIANAIRFFEHERYSLTAWVVMDDHMHAIVRPHDGWTLPKITHSWKSFTAHKLVKEFGRRPPVWLSESYDRLVRNERERMRFSRYILNNPSKRWPGCARYRWVWPAEE
jgi:REP-associated tyrosine transposase